MYPKIYLAIDNCVASKRWCEPAHWMKLFADCGVYYVEASADNEIDPLYTEKSYLSDWADAVLADADKTGVKVMNLYSGHGTYATLGLAHPDKRIRERIHHDWLDRMVDLAAKMNAGLGFFCHAFDQSTLNSAEKYQFAYGDLVKRLADLAAYAAEKNLDSIGVEQMYTPHQVPWTVANAGQLLKDCYALNGKDFYLTIDTGHQSGQRKFAAKDDATLFAAFDSIRANGRAEGIYLGSAEAEKAIVSGALKGESNAALLEIVKADRAAYPWLYSVDSDGDTYCGSTDVKPEPLRRRRVRGEPLGSCRKVILEFTIHRLYCHRCHHREMEHIPFLPHPKARLTKSLERTILELRPHMSVQTLANFYDLRWHTIKELEKKQLKKKYSRIQTAHIKAIGIDEIHVGKGMQNQQYLTIVRDLQSGAVIHVGEGKGISALAGALKKLKKSKLRIVTMDMANAYYSWISENFPKANIVFDHFHVIKLMNDKLDLVRRRITAKMDEVQRKQLKGLRFIFLRNNEDFLEDARHILKNMRGDFQDL